MCPHAITVTVRTSALVLFIVATTADESIFEQKIGPTPPGDPRLGLRVVSNFRCFDRLILQHFVCRLKLEKSTMSFDELLKEFETLSCGGIE